MRVQRVPVDDVLVRDGETAILLEGALILLSELSAVIYELTEEPVEVEQLARDLESAFGPPVGSTSLQGTYDTIEAMMSHGLIATEPEQ